VDPRAPQRGLACAIVRISVRMSAGTVGRPVRRRLSRPPQPEASSVPGDEGLRLHDDEGLSPSGPEAREYDPEPTVCLPQPQLPRPGTLQHRRLVP
jgi:hypothetical protein